jgi:voltage-gated potassium channel
VRVWVVAFACFAVGSALLLALYFLVPLTSNGLLHVSLPTVVLVLALVVLPLTWARLVVRLPMMRYPAVSAVLLALVVVEMTLVAFASLYLWLALGSSTENFSGLGTRLDALYFAVTVSTTLGFGDIVPVSQEARAAVTIHQLVTVGVLAAVVRLTLNLGREERAARLRGDGPGEDG